MQILILTMSRGYIRKKCLSTKSKQGKEHVLGGGGIFSWAQQ